MNIIATCDGLVWLVLWGNRFDKCNGKRVADQPFPTMMRGGWRNLFRKRGKQNLVRRSGTKISATLHKMVGS